ncbi:IS3 family transposase [Tetragenococcus halophilus]|uniref:IS3 family transposase n=2 Tax=Tetragenococcus halophilus TaxID=51669 RepID=A0A3G5FH93_TETHA|nr:IS3 family transposase [Tetragenococcus halophilus]AYW49713.1 IS3 family transposase [Tetragenococcus halophilus]MCF1686275.1 IS3 family transposase [Tetragenococcus halophilus]
MMAKQYNQETRELVLQLNEQGQSVPSLAREYGISEATIFNWKKEYTPDKETGKSQADIHQMEKKMHRLEQENDILKKGYHHIHERLTDDSFIYDLIDEESQEYPIRMLTQVLEISKTTYYASKDRCPSQRSQENEQLKEEILQIYEKSKRRYGAPKITYKLKQLGWSVGLKRVQRLMRELGVHSVIRKKYRPATNHEKVTARENLLKQDFSTTSINQKWGADITYIHTQKEGWTYLASVMDLYSRKIIGYSYGKQMTTSIAVEAFHQAVQNQQLKEGAGLVLQTDLGTQYTSDAFEQLLLQYHVSHSYSRKGTPYDNSGIESFHATLKKEEVYLKHYKTFDEARLALFQYINGWYNRERIHGKLNYLTPQQAEDQVKMSA